jgi:hypothetical protein
MKQQYKREVDYILIVILTLYCITPFLDAWLRT